MTLLQFAIGGGQRPRRRPERPVARPASPSRPASSRRRGPGDRGGGRAAAGWCSPRSGAGALVLAAVVLAIGLWYDLRAKGTTLSWLPFAVGHPAAARVRVVRGRRQPARRVPRCSSRRPRTPARPRDRERHRRHGAGRRRRRSVGRPRAGAARASGWLVLVLHAVVAVLALATAAVARGADRAGRWPSCWPPACRSAGAVARARGDRSRWGTGLARARVGDPGGRGRAARGRVAGGAQRRLGGDAARVDGPRGRGPVVRAQGRRRGACVRPPWSGRAQAGCTPNSPGMPVVIVRDRQHPPRGSSIVRPDPPLPRPRRRRRRARDVRGRRVRGRAPWPARLRPRPQRGDAHLGCRRGRERGPRDRSAGDRGARDRGAQTRRTRPRTRTPTRPRRTPRRRTTTARSCRPRHRCRPQTASATTVRSSLASPT